jgi:hypothetical protein
VATLGYEIPGDDASQICDVPRRSGVAVVLERRSGARKLQAWTAIWLLV